MLRKFILIVILLANTYLLYAQEYAIQFKLQESSDFTLNPLDQSYDHKAFPIVSNDSSQVMMLLSTSGLFKAEFLTKGLQKISSMSIELPKVKELDILMGGFQGDSTNYFAVFTNRKKTNFSALNISTTNQQITATKYSMEIKGEKILHSFTSNNSFYILSMVSNSSILRVYRLSPDKVGNDLVLSKRSYDFAKDDLDETLPTLYKELLDYTFRGRQSLTKIPLDHQTSLIAASSYFKLYIGDQHIILTLDHVQGRTSIFEMTLNSSIKNYQLIELPNYVLNNPYKYSANSYLHGDTLIQMISTKESLSLLMVDRFSQTEEDIVEYSISKAQIDSFSTDLRYRGKVSYKRNTKKTTARVLRDIHKYQSGLIVTRNENGQIQFEVGTSISAGYINNQLEKKNLAKAHEVLTQATSENISSIGIAFDCTTLEPVPAKSFTMSYLPVLSFKKSKGINNPLLETIYLLEENYYYTWYNTSNENVIISKISSIN